MAVTLGNKGLLLVTSIILLIGFFSSNIAYTGQHHVGKTSIIGRGTVYSCLDAELAESYLNAGTTNLGFDATGDRRFDMNDYQIILSSARTTTCGIADQCAKDSCRNGILNRCVPHKEGWMQQDGTPVTVWEPVLPPNRAARCEERNGRAYYQSAILSNQPF